MYELTVTIDGTSHFSKHATKQAAKASLCDGRLPVDAWTPSGGLFRAGQRVGTWGLTKLIPPTKTVIDGHLVETGISRPAFVYTGTVTDPEGRSSRYVYRSVLAEPGTMLHDEIVEWLGEGAVPIGEPEIVQDDNMAHLEAVLELWA